MRTAKISTAFSRSTAHNLNWPPLPMPTVVGHGCACEDCACGGKRVPTEGEIQAALFFDSKDEDPYLSHEPQRKLEFWLTYYRFKAWLARYTRDFREALAEHPWGGR